MKLLKIPILQNKQAKKFEIRDEKLSQNEKLRFCASSDIKIKQKVINVAKKNDKWSICQQRKYVRFLAKSKHLFELSNREKQKLKINQKLRRAIATKTAPQCHSHHQKMVHKYGSVEQILNRHQQYLVCTQNEKNREDNNTAGDSLHQGQRSDKENDEIVDVCREIVLQEQWLTFMQQLKIYEKNEAMSAFDNDY